MRIKIKRSFRAVLSLLVVVMLLVWVMPSQVLDVGAYPPTTETPTFFVYFCKEMGTKAWAHDVDIYIYAEKDGTALAGTTSNRVKMLYPDGVHSAVGYYMHYYVLSDIPDKIIFSNNQSDNNYKTDEITGNDIQNGHIYYTSGGNAQLPTVKHVLYRPYAPITNLSLSATDKATLKDLNVATATSAFTKQSGRDYCDATFYDYFSDYELVTKHSRSAINVDVNGYDGYYWKPSSGGSVRGYAWDTAIKYMPNLTLNYYLSEYYKGNDAGYNTTSANVYPLYFGNFVEQTKYNFRTEINSGNAYMNYEFKYKKSDSDTSYANFYYANNAKGRNDSGNVSWSSATAAAAQGLYGSTLAGGKDGNIRLSDNSTLVPFFNASWLESKGLGASYNVQMPFFEMSTGTTFTDVITSATVTSTADNVYHELDGSKQAHALRMSKYGNDYYLAESNTGVLGYTADGGVKTATNGVGYDFFPFSDPLATTDSGGVYFDRMNYNFGFSTTIKFTMTEQGTHNNSTIANGGKPITFEFSGDDDLLVYVDGYLVMDIGGDHGAVKGKIDFQAKNATVKTVKNGSSETSNKVTAFPAELDGIYTDRAVHYLKVFCVERGLFESNMMIRYNLPSVGKRSLKVEETVTEPTGLSPIITSSPSNFTANVNNIKFGMSLQFKDLSVNNSEYGLYTGNNPTVAGMIANGFTTDSTNNRYLFESNQDSWFTYLNDFAKNGNYNLKFQELTAYIDPTNKATASDIFTTNWTFKQNGTGSDITGNGISAPVSSSSGGSRPLRGTKTTSTMASSANTLELLGTEDNPDQIIFANTFNTATVNITIQKILTDRKSSDANKNLAFSFKIEFDDVADMGLEDVYDANGTQATDIILEQVVNITLTGNSLINSSTQYSFVVPVGTSYRITETSVQTGYSMKNNTNGEWTKVTADGNVTATITNEPDDVSPKEIILRVQVGCGTIPSSVTAPASVTLSIQRKRTDEQNFVQLTTQEVTLTSGGKNEVLVYNYKVEDVDTAFVDKVKVGNDYIYYEYRILELNANGVVMEPELIDSEHNRYGGHYDSNIDVTYYPKAGSVDYDYTKNAQGNLTTETINETECQVLSLAVYNGAAEAHSDTPATGGRGGYIPIAGGFIAILLAGAGYFIYKKRLFA